VQKKIYSEKTKFTVKMFHEIQIWLAC